MQPGDLVKSIDKESPHWDRIGEVKSIDGGKVLVEFSDRNEMNKFHFGAIALVEIDSSKLERVQQA